MYSSESIEDIKAELNKLRLKRIKYVRDNLTEICDELIPKINRVKPDFLVLTSVKYDKVYENTEYRLFPENICCEQRKVEANGCIYYFNIDDQLYKVNIKGDCDINLVNYECTDVVLLKVTKDGKVNIEKNDETGLSLMLKADNVEKFARSVKDITFEKLHRCYRFKSTTLIKAKEISYPRCDYDSSGRDIKSSLDDYSLDRKYIERVLEVNRLHFEDFSNSWRRPYSPLLVKSIDIDNKDIYKEIYRKNAQKYILEYTQLEHVILKEISRIKLSQLPEVDRYSFSGIKDKITIDRELSELEIDKGSSEMWISKAVEIFDKIEFEYFPSKRLSIRNIVFEFKDIRSSKVKSAAKV